MKRRKFLAGLAAALSAAWQRPAKAGWAIFQTNSSGGGGPIPGVTTQAIDGGPTYYASNNFTYAATAASVTNPGSVPNMWQACTGWDDPHFFPIGSWRDLISTQTGAGFGSADAWHDLGLNTIFGSNPNTIPALAGSNSIWVVQYTGDARNPSDIIPIAGYGNESVGFMSFDEPQTWWETVVGVGGLASQNITASYTGETNVATTRNILTVTAEANHGQLIRGNKLTGNFIFPQTLGTDFNGIVNSFGTTVFPELPGGLGPYGMGNQVTTPATLTATTGSTGAFTVAPSTAWPVTGTIVGATARLFDTATDTKIMTGPVTAWNPATGSMTVNITSVILGSGSAAGWTIQLDVPSETIAVASVAANPNLFTDKRFWWVNFTPAQLGVPPNYTPSSDMRQIMNQAVATPSGIGIWATRTINMIGIDNYCMSAGTTYGQGIQFANVYGGIGTQAGVSSFTSLTIGTPPYTTAPFTLTNMPQPNFIVGAKCKLDDGAGNVIFGTLATINTITGVATMNVVQVTGSGTHSSWSFQYSLAASQMNQATHYGDMVDQFRSYNSTTFPCYAFIDADCAFDSSSIDATGTGPRPTTPPENNAMAWSTIMHRARWVVYFAQSLLVPANGGAFISTYGHTIQAGQTISNFDQARATHRLIQTLAPVINSSFAVAGPTQPVTVSSVGGAGFTLPFSNFTFPINGSQPFLGATFNNSLSPASTVFECMAHWFTGTTETINGVTLTQNRMWVWAMYRGPETDTNITANFTLASGIPPTPTKVTRIYSDGVIGVTAVGANTTITVGSTGTSTSRWIAVGDTITIVGTVGVANLNGTFTVSSVTNTSVTFATSPSTSGSLTTNGVIIAQHDITISGGTTFSDIFPNGNSVGIYKVT